MTKEETKKAIAVMQAYCEGKTIEYWDGDEWNEIKDPIWAWADDCNDFIYRVKPEPPRLKYRPFESQEEITEAIKEHGIMLKKNSTGICKIIREYGRSYICIGENKIDDSFALVFNNYTFADGTIFGKLVEE